MFTSCTQIKQFFISRVASRRVASHRVASRRVASRLVASHRIASHLISSHRISSHLVSSHFISSHLILEYPFGSFWAQFGCPNDSLERSFWVPKGVPGRTPGAPSGGTQKGSVSATRPTPQMWIIAESSSSKSGAGPPLGPPGPVLPHNT